MEGYDRMAWPDSSSVSPESGIARAVIGQYSMLISRQRVGGASWMNSRVHVLVCTNIYLTEIPSFEFPVLTHYLRSTGKRVPL